MATLQSLMFILVSTALSAVPLVGGQHHLQRRMIAGVEIRDRCRDPYNWMVALQFKYLTGPITFCSAVMLTDRILVTTASCIYQFINMKNAPIYAVVGERDMIGRDTGEQALEVDSVRVHKSYNETTLDNNIGLIRLNQSAILGPCVRPALKVFEDSGACTDMDPTCIMAGWGPYGETTKPTNSRLPRFADITVFGDLVSSLLSRDQTGGDQPKGSLFAEAKNPLMKACFFDWGGVVSCKRGDAFVLRGLIGEHNCNSDLPPPILVIDVPYFQSWIDLCTNDWPNCPSR